MTLYCNSKCFDVVLNVNRVVLVCLVALLGILEALPNIAINQLLHFGVIIFRNFVGTFGGKDFLKSKKVKKGFYGVIY